MYALARWRILWLAALVGMAAAGSAFADEIWLDEGSIEITLPSGRTFELQGGQYAKCGGGSCEIIPLEDAPQRADAGNDVDTAETGDTGGSDPSSPPNAFQGALEPPTQASPN